MPRKRNTKQVSPSRESTTMPPTEKNRDTSPHKRRKLQRKTLWFSIISKLEKLVKQHTIWTVVFLNLFLFCLTYKIFTPAFLFNDDPMMMLLASGVVRGSEASAHLIYTNCIVGFLLVFLYSFTINFPWYALYLIFGLFIAHSIFLYIILDRQPKIETVSLYILYFFLISTKLLLNLQFTITAVTVSCAGMALLIYSNASAIEDKSRLCVKNFLSVRIVIAIFLIVFGSMIRYEGALLAMGICSPGLIFSFTHNSRAEFISRAAFIGIAGTVAFIFLKMNDAYYSQDHYYKDCYERNSLAGELLNYRAMYRINEKERIKILNEINWTYNDFIIFQNWFALNRELYSLEKFKKILSRTSVLTPGRKFSDVLKSLKKILQNTYVLSCFSVFVFLALFLQLRSSTVLVSLVSFGIYIFLTMYMSYAMKPPPPRVFLPMFAYFALIPCLLYNTRNFINFAQFSLLRKIIFMVLLATLAVQLKSTYNATRRQSKSNTKLQDLIPRAIKEINPQKDQLYLSWTGAFSWQFLNPFGKLAYLENLITVESRLYPSTQKVLHGRNISDIYLEFINSDDVFLVISTPFAEGRMNLYKRFMAEHYNRGVQESIVHRNPAFTVFKISEL